MTARRPSPRAVTGQEARREPQKPVQPPAPACAAPLAGPSWHGARPRARAEPVCGLASPSPRSSLRTQPDVVPHGPVWEGGVSNQEANQGSKPSEGWMNLLNTNQRLSPPTSLSSSPTSFISPRGILNETHPSSDTKAALMKPHLFLGKSSSSPKETPGTAMNASPSLTSAVSMNLSDTTGSCV